MCNPSSFSKKILFQSYISFRFSVDFMLKLCYKNLLDYAVDDLIIKAKSGRKINNLSKSLLKKCSL